MTDPKQGKSGADEFNWDDALGEWEKEFVPEIAEDKETKKPAKLSGAGTAERPARPLYRPPPPAPNPPPPPSKPAPPKPPAARLPAPVAPAAPKRVLPAPARPPPLSRAGLGSLFDKVEGPTATGLGLRDPNADEATEVSQRPTGIPAAWSDDEEPYREPQETSPGDEDAFPPRQLMTRSSAPPPPPLHDSNPRLHDPDAETYARNLLDGAPTVSRTGPNPDRFSYRPVQDSEPEDESTKIFLGPTSTRPQDVEPPEPAARAWIADEAREAFEARAEWMEAEARATLDPGAQARGLLAVSEIRALLGDTEGAHKLATEARDLAPTRPLAHKQARGLAATSRDPSMLIEALDHEVATVRIPAARAHAALLAADILRLSGDAEGAAKRWNAAAQTGDGDVRISVARAAYALSTGDLAAALALQAAPEALPIASALGAAIHLRGGSSNEPAEGALAANDALQRARRALDGGDASAGALAIAELALVPGLASGAEWLAAALGATRASTRAKAAEWFRARVDARDEAARRPLAACALELGDATMLHVALEGGGFSVADRAVLATLSNLGSSDLDAHAAALADTEALAPLASAIAGTRPLAGSDEESPDDRARRVETRAARVAGNAASRNVLRLARLVAGGATAKTIEDAALAAREDAPTESRAVVLEVAVREGRFGEVSDTLRSWTAGDGPRGGPSDNLLAAALVAERAGDAARALAAYREAQSSDACSEGLLRAIAALDPNIELPQELNELADQLGEGARGALARLEAVVREQGVDDATRLELLERAHTAAPTLPIASFMAERLARRGGDVDEVLRWIRGRRAAATDPLEQALDNVREALLIADQNPELATERLEEAHRTRTADVALRELYERLAREPPADRGLWREQRAAISVGNAKPLYYMEAAHEYERVGDKAGALRAAEAAVTSGGTMLARLARERAEVEGGEPARYADELLGLARETEDTRARREAYECLADLDATGNADSSSAILWHRSILEETPDHKPSLRHIEHALITEGRDDELEPIATGIARALKGATGGEGVAHADLAARLRSRGAAGDWESTRELAELAASQPEPSIGSLRLLYSHARAKKDDRTALTAVLALVARASRPPEVAALLVRGAESASRLNAFDEARDLLERAATEDPGDIVTWDLLAEARKQTGDLQGAAEAKEGFARTSVVPAHQVAAWHEAGHLWQDGAKDLDRAVVAFEQAAAIDVTYKDVFPRLSALYTVRGARGELASLLERRIGSITDPEERVTMEVERGRALLEVGELEGARGALNAALEASPDHTAALGIFADLCAKESDWDGAEQAWVRLARLLTTVEEQRDIYARLGDLYLSRAVNLSRAELAFKEVLKRAPGDLMVREQLIDVYKRLNDAPHAAEIVQELIVQTKDPIERRRRLIELAQIHEVAGHDPRKAEQVLESARREAPTDVTVLRALAEFYARHKQMPAVQILLDRAAADARRAFAAGRFAPQLFEVMRTVFDLRGKKDAALAVAATLAALDGQQASIRGGSSRALDPRLDDLLAPEVLSQSLRALLAQGGDALDVAVPYDLRAVQAAPVQGALLASVLSLTSAAGIPSAQVFASAQLGHSCIPVGSSPATIVVGSGLASSANERARGFLLVRTVKLILSHASALVRTPANDLVVLLSAWFQAFNPSWTPQGINPTALASAAKRVSMGMPKRLGPEVGSMALEAAGTIGNQVTTLGVSALTWANRAALLAVGDPNVALDAIAWTYGKEGAPTDPKERASWVVRTREASDLLAFSVSDAYAEARVRLGLDK